MIDDSFVYAGKSADQRFWEKVHKTDLCWIWTGAKSVGYGHFGTQQVLWTAHRYAWTRLVGPIPEGFDIDHLCRNRACVNPDHLEPVTRAVNLRRGEGAKLTAQDVAAIRRLPGPHTEMAERFGVDASTISRIRSGKTWLDAAGAAQLREVEARLREGS